MPGEGAAATESRLARARCNEIAPGEGLCNEIAPGERLCNEIAPGEGALQRDCAWRGRRATRSAIPLQNATPSAIPLQGHHAKRVPVARPPREARSRCRAAKRSATPLCSPATPLPRNTTNARATRPLPDTSPRAHAPTCMVENVRKVAGSAPAHDQGGSNGSKRTGN